MKELTFGEYLRKIRKSKKLSMMELATASGLSYSGISRIEKNERGIPKPSTIKLLAQGLNEPYEVLMKHAGYMNLEDTNEEYEYTSDPTITPELRELLDTLEELSPEEKSLIISQALTFAEGMKARKNK